MHDMKFYVFENQHLISLGERMQATETNPFISLYDTVSQTIEDSIIAVNEWLDENPTMAKVVMVAMHVFRAASMAALLYVLPFHPIVNLAISLTASVVYFGTIEKKGCPFRFSLLSCAGGEAMVMAQWSISAIINQIAFESLKNIAFTVGGFAAITAYAIGAVYISHQAIEAKKQCCCSVIP